MTKKQLHAMKVKAGKLGGSVSSAAKRKAAKMNGAKGGRKRIEAMDSVAREHSTWH